MVNLSNIVLGRKPLLIYGVKRGKVPTKLRPRLSPKKQEAGRNQCLEEMYRLLTCWRDSGYDDMYCKHEITSFTKCVAYHLNSDDSKPHSEWTRDEINAAIKHHTPYLRRARNHYY